MLSSTAGAGIGKSVARASIGSARGAGMFEPFKESSSNLRRRIEDGASCSSASVRSRTFASDTLRSRLGGDWYRTNLMDFTSSRNVDRTNAYTALILLVEGKVFSSCVRSVNFTRMVVLGHLSRRAFSFASRAARGCNGAFTRACVRAARLACAAKRSAAVGVK